MRKILWAIGALGMIGLVLLVMNWGNIQRLLLVKDFLDPKQVVYNFAHAGDAFHKRELKVLSLIHI